MHLKRVQHWEKSTTSWGDYSRADCSHYDKYSFPVQQNLPGSNLYPLPLVDSLWNGSLLLCSPQWWELPQTFFSQGWTRLVSVCEPWSLWFPGLLQSPADAPALPHPAGWALCQVFWGFPFVLFQQRQIFEETALSLWDVVLWFVCLYCCC